jgi:hypothetical protein
MFGAAIAKQQNPDGEHLRSDNRSLLLNKAPWEIDSRHVF